MPTCKIKWVDDSDIPTPDNHPAVAEVRAVFGDLPTDVSAWFPICEDHIKRLPPKWEKRELPMAANETEEYTNQQTWAAMAYDLIREEILPEAPERALVTYGFPHVGDMARGECWLTEGQDTKGSDGLKADASAVIFIHPSQWSDPDTVLMVLTHEMIHASGVLGHEGAYGAIAHKIGLCKSDAGLFDNPDQGLRNRLQEIRETLPSFPVSAMSPENSIPMPHVVGEGTPFETPKAFCNGGVDATEPKKPKKKQNGRLRLHQCRCGNKIRAGRDNAQAECALCHSCYKLVKVKGTNPYEEEPDGDDDDKELSYSANGEGGLA